MKRSERKHMVIPKVWGVSLWIVLIGITLYVVSKTAYRAGYSKGFSEGYSKGEGENNSSTYYSIGYDVGYTDALAAYGLDPENLVDSAGESWPIQVLRDCWIEVGESVQGKPREMYISEENISMTVGEESISFGYTLPESAHTQDRPTGEVYLELKDCREFIHLILHAEAMEDGTVIPILSATIAELDGRGEIIVTEFVRVEDAPHVSSAFRSRSRILRDEQDAPSMRK